MSNRGDRGFRVGLNAAALFALTTLALPALGACLSVGQSMGSKPVIFPTKMITPTAGWALVGGSQLWRTTDGGISWTNVSPPHLPDRVVNADGNDFIDQNQAFITELGGGRRDSPSFHWVTFRTVDGGKTWRKGATLTDPFNSGNAQAFFLDAATGWFAISDESTNPQPPMLYGTRDGGLHWTLITSNAGAGSLPDMATQCGANVKFASATVGWMALGLCIQVPSQNQSSSPELRFVRDLLLVTHDDGVTWVVQKLPINQEAGDRVDTPIFFDRLRGLLVVSGAHPALLATSDGGTTWSTRSLPGEVQSGVDFVDPNHGWAFAGPSSMFTKTRDDSQQRIPMPLYRTDDGGSTWIPVRTTLELESPAGVALSSFHFVDMSTGFLTLYTPPVGPTEFLRTADGGLTWVTVVACKKGLGNQYPPAACPSLSFNSAI